MRSTYEETNHMKVADTEWEEKIMHAGYGEMSQRRMGERDQRKTQRGVHMSFKKRDLQ